MASTNPSSARLSRSTSDLSAVNHQTTSGASSSRTDSTTKDTLPRAKIQALEQFVKFGRKGKQKEKEKSNHKATEFPPPSWFNSTPISTTSSPPPPANAAPNTAARAAAHRDNSSPLPPPRTPPQLAPRTDSPTDLEPPRLNSEIALNTSRRVAPTAPVAPSETTRSFTLERRGSSFPNVASIDGDDVAPPEPLTLARRIQALLRPQTALEAPTPSLTDAATSSGAARSDIAGPATPGGSMPPGPVPVSDSRFLALLGNTNVMSGSLDKGRQSVFAILDRLRPSARSTEVPSGSTPLSISEEEQDDEESEGDSSIMLYGPLVPSEDSEVELAASDIMSVFDDGETFEFEQPARPLSFMEAGEQLTPRSPPRALSPEASGTSAQDDGPANASQSDTQKDPSNVRWFDTWKGKVMEGGKLVSDKVVEGTKSWKGKAVEDRKAEDRKIVKTKTRWVPSPDKISFQATWWGYRLCVFAPTFMCITGLSS